MMAYTYYPGCSQEVSTKAYNLSTWAVAGALGLELVELDDWNCCGTSPSYSLRSLSTFALNARNLGLAERHSPGCDLVTICNGCFGIMDKTNRRLAEDAELRERVGEALAVIDLEYRGSVRVRHLLEVLVNDLGQETIQEKVTHPLEGLQVAPYLGCAFSRPSGIDDAEFPTALGDLLSWIGADVVDYPLRASCCGGILMMSDKKEVALKLVHNLLADAVRRGASCLATACPLCHLNVEAYQGQVNARFGTDFSLPVLFFTQLLGVSLGLGREELGLGTELVSAAALLAPHMT
ncbi:MAG: disulfide reductase [Chloroflexi bacterium B3_Chlor]|nr:MAG: disulfide reductase [Chloroflexi bacterium B3_Chlor]